MIAPAKRRINQLLEYKKYNCIVTSIDEEGGFIDNDYKEFMSLRYSNKTIKLNIPKRKSKAGIQLSIPHAKPKPPSLQKAARKLSKAIAEVKQAVLRGRP